MDRRDIANQYRGVLQDVDVQRMCAIFDDGEQVHTVHLCFEVCGTCEGRGLHVNPSIDAHGLSAEDFYDDPDFAEAYFEGRYNVLCHECHGDRVVPEIDETANPPALVRAVQQAAADAWAEAQAAVHAYEMGY